MTGRRDGQGVDSRAAAEFEVEQDGAEAVVVPGAECFGEGGGLINFFALDI